jgi:Subtilase family
MGWLRKTQRHHRGRCRPKLECLEIRNLLSIATPPADIGPLTTSPVPADTNLNAASASSFDVITGASQVRAAYGVDGTGLTAAVIDMGVNYRHEALGGGIGPGFKVEAGYDFSSQTNDPNPINFQHGTAVAGLIASADPAHPGVAPGADLVALKVFSDNSQGNFDWIANALQWVVDNHVQYNVTVVNLSISDENTYTLNWFAHDGGVGERITTLIHQLDTLNIPVVSAAGNNFNGQQGMGFAGIVGDTISVTSTDASDHLAANAQRLGTAVGGDLATDLAAPGVGLLAPADGNNFANVNGTSFSTAIVSGAIILLQQIYEQRFGQLPTVAQLDNWLKDGSDPISDPTTGIVLGRLDIPKAASLVPSPAPPPAPTPIPTPPPPVADPPPVITPPAIVTSPDPAPPAQQPVQPTTPPPPPTTQPDTPAPPAQQVAAPTDVILNGLSLGTLSLDDSKNPWSLYLSSFALPKALSRVQIWTNVTSQTITNLQPQSQGQVDSSRPQPRVSVRIKGERADLRTPRSPAAPRVVTSSTAPAIVPTGSSGRGNASQRLLRSLSRGLSDLVAAVRIRT